MNALRISILSLVILVLTSPVMAQARERDGARRDRSSYRNETRGGDASHLARYGNGDGRGARRIAAAPLVGGARGAENVQRDNRASRDGSDRGEARRSSHDRHGVDRSSTSVRHSSYSNSGYRRGSTVFVSYASGYGGGNYYSSSYSYGGSCGYAPRYGHVYRPVGVVCRPVVYARPRYCYPTRYACDTQPYYRSGVSIYYRGRF